MTLLACERSSGWPELAGTGRNGEGHSGRCLFLDDVPQNLTRLLQILGWDSIPGLIMNEPVSSHEVLLTG